MATVFAMPICPPCMGSSCSVAFFYYFGHQVEQRYFQYFFFYFDFSLKLGIFVKGLWAPWTKKYLPHIYGMCELLPSELLTFAFCKGSWSVNMPLIVVDCYGLGIALLHMLVYKHSWLYKFLYWNMGTKEVPIALIPF